MNQNVVEITIMNFVITVLLVAVAMVWVNQPTALVGAIFMGTIVVLSNIAATLYVTKIKQNAELKREIEPLKSQKNETV